MKWSVLSLVALVGCAVDPDIEVAYKPPPPPPGTEEGCIGVQCTGNSPLYAALGIFELSRNPWEVSSRGFSIDQSQIVLAGPNHKLVDLHVDGITLTAYDTVDHLWKSGINLPDVRVRIKHSSGEQYDLRIADPLTTSFYAPLPVATPLFAYKITYRPAFEHVDWEDLCPYVDPFENGTQGTWAVFWRGDRLDPKTGVFYKHGEEVGGWFNISCAGEAPGKVVRTGATYAAMPATTMVQAQAALDMFTARYCPNTNERYTKLGTKIDWDDKTGSNTLPPAPGYKPYEAIWNGNGAYCVRTEYTRWPETEFGGYACDPKPCSDAELASWKSYGEVRSGLVLSP